MSVPVLNFSLSGNSQDDFNVNSYQYNIGSRGNNDVNNYSYNQLHRNTDTNYDYNQYFNGRIVNTKESRDNILNKPLMTQRNYHSNDVRNNINSYNQSYQRENYNKPLAKKTYSDDVRNNYNQHNYLTNKQSSKRKSDHESYNQSNLHHESYNQNNLHHESYNQNNLHHESYNKSNNPRKNYNQNNNQNNNHYKESNSENYTIDFSPKYGENIEITSKMCIIKENITHEEFEKLLDINKDFFENNKISKYFYPYTPDDKEFDITKNNGDCYIEFTRTKFSTVIVNYYAFSLFSVSEHKSYTRLYMDKNFSNFKLKRKPKRDYINPFLLIRYVYSSKQRGYYVLSSFFKPNAHKHLCNVVYDVCHIGHVFSTTSSFLNNSTKIPINNEHESNSSVSSNKKKKTKFSLLNDLATPSVITPTIITPNANNIFSPNSNFNNIFSPNNYDNYNNYDNNLTDTETNVTEYDNNSTTKVSDNNSITKISDNNSITKISDNNSTTKISDNNSTTKVYDNNSTTKVYDNNSTTKISDDSTTKISDDSTIKMFDDSTIEMSDVIITIKTNNNDKTNEIKTKLENFLKQLTS